MTAQARRIGVFGGTFDPIHIGHLAAAEDAAADLTLEAVLFVPNASPPHKQDRGVSRPQDRMEMVRRAIANNPRFDLCLVEIERGGLSYTIDTLRELRRSLPAGSEIVFLTGWEALADLHTWREPEAILDEFHVALIDRPTRRPVAWEGVERRYPGIREKVRVVSVPRLEISADELRDRVRRGLPIRYYVPDAVERYIREHGLYIDPS